MITKLTLLISIMFSTLGLNGSAVKFDNSVVQEMSGNSKIALASPNNIILPDLQIKPKILKNAPQTPIYAQNYLLADVENGITFLKKDVDKQVPIASTTKIMTATIVLENYKLSDIVTISAADANQVGATANFRVGEQLTVEQLLYCMLIKSVNGAADALAEFANQAGETGYGRFVATMNAKAKELGMNDTNYHDPAGLDVTGYSSAYDLYLITKYAMKNETFAKIVATQQYVAHDVSGTIAHTLENSNRLVREWQYQGALGVKTGYMPEASHCLVGAARRNGHTLVAIILHTIADTPSASAEEARKLLDWGFTNIDWGDGTSNAITTPIIKSPGNISTGASDL